jgi:hypothetical protein
VHEGITEKLGVTSRAGQVASGDNEVGIAIVNLNRETGRLDDVEFLFHIEEEDPPKSSL